MDAGRKYTDAQIASIERELKKEYALALKDLQEESRKTLERFEKWDAKQRARLNANEITMSEYTQWRKNYMLRSNQVDSLINELSSRMVHTDEIATDIINGRAPKVYAENMNYATFDIERQSKVNTNFSLISDDAVTGLITGETPIFPLARVDADIDWKWNERQVRSALTQGILLGEGIPKITKRLQRVTDMDRRAATRNARTLMGRAQNAGRMAGIKRAKALGLPVKKMWIACLDNVTRDSHVDVDGEVQEYDHEFSNGLDYPCASGPPEEVYNCRCDMRPIYAGEEIDVSDLNLRNTDKMEQASYEEWKNKHKQGKGGDILGLSASGYSEEQQNALRQLLANADPTTRAVYERFSSQFKPALSPEEGHSKAYYSPVDNQVHLTQSAVAEGNDLHTPYQTHFHEYGHNIDYLAGTTYDGYASMDYRDSKGRTFGEIINSEWESMFEGKALLRNFRENLDVSKGGMGGYNYVESQLRDWRRFWGLSRDNAQYLELVNQLKEIGNDNTMLELFYMDNLDKFKGLDQSSFLSSTYRSVFTEFKQDMYRKYELHERGDLSDMLEPFVVNKIGKDCEYPLGCGHGWLYARSDKLELETFAEMFASEIANPESLEVIKKFLPESYKAYREILEGML